MKKSLLISTLLLYSPAADLVCAVASVNNRTDVVRTYDIRNKRTTRAQEKQFYFSSTRGYGHGAPVPALKRYETSNTNNNLKQKHQSPDK